ncbi:unnamed protein product [Heterobilharzia americana]|nr:unnamed protein product [Heterobilharzia americana]
MSLLAFEDVRVCTPTQSMVTKKLTLTQYFLTFNSQDNDFSIMYRAIDNVRLFESSADRRFTPSTQIGIIVKRRRDTLLSISLQIRPIVSFVRIENYDWPNNIKEILSSGNWRISQLNKDYTLCNSYPKSLIVPAKCDDLTLLESSRFRQGGRLPALIYYHKPRQTALLIAAEPVTVQTTGGNSQNPTGSLISSGSSFVVTSQMTTTTSNSFTTSLTQPKSSNLVISQSSRNSTSFSSMSTSRCRLDEQLLTSVLPDRYRGVILDLRTQSETKKPQVTSGLVEFEQYYPQWRRVCRPVETIMKLNTTFRKFIYACSMVGRLTRSASTTFGALQSGISDSIGMLSSAAFYPISSLGLRNNSSNNVTASISFDGSVNPSAADVDESLNTSSRNGLVSHLASLDIQSPNSTGEPSLNTTTNSSNSSNNAVKKSKRFAAWLSLVREALAAAVAGATALDALDAFAQQQLQQEQCLLAEKQRKSPKSHILKKPNYEDLMYWFRIILNPEARTIQGFQTLIDHTWLNSGHPFTDRCRNSAFCLKAPGDESPVFILFLDCVWQLLRQYPNAFEFTDELLCVLAKHAYFSEFGTFLGNSSQEREVLNIPSKTISLWSYINQPTVIGRFQNPFYSGPKDDDSQSDGVDVGYACWPCLAAQALDVWEELYQQQLVGAHTGLWKLPRVMAHAIVDKFEAERLRAIQLRTTLDQLINEAINANILVKQ